MEHIMDVVFGDPDVTKEERKRRAECRLLSSRVGAAGKCAMDWAVAHESNAERLPEVLDSVFEAVYDFILRKEKFADEQEKKITEENSQ